MTGEQAVRQGEKRKYAKYLKKRHFWGQKELPHRRFVVLFDARGRSFPEPPCQKGVLAAVVRQPVVSQNSDEAPGRCGRAGCPAMNSPSFGLFWNHVHPPIPTGALGAGPLGQQGAGGDHRLPPRGEPGPPRSARAEEAHVHRRGTPQGRSSVNRGSAVS